MKVFDKGKRVSWRGRRATVAYVRMAPPLLRHAEAYSIVLDDQLYLRAYEGTIVSAAEVVELYFCCSAKCPGYTFKASEYAHNPRTCTP